ncbi:MAG TPA: hypothetical protein VMB51_13815 [Solirubrobacteraceae bacterium]|nr:hypothetical protein [Solirubrobacteraceae bacterium]
MRRKGLAGIVLAVACLVMVSDSYAQSPAKVCVPEKEGRAVLTTNAAGNCKKKYLLEEFSKEGPMGKEGKEGKEGKAGPEGKEGREGPEGQTGLTSGELATLKSILPHITYVSSGVGGNPTIQFSGVNVQILNGDGSTRSVNGEGNLVLGYDELPGEQTGSHNLILGEGQTFTSFGGIDAGAFNTISGIFASVTGGEGNVASGEVASVSGGGINTANEEETSVTGGEENTASGFRASVTGGSRNDAGGLDSWIGGGLEHTASGSYEAIP